jgi:hypothetical protein
MLKTCKIFEVAYEFHTNGKDPIHGENSIKLTANDVISAMERAKILVLDILSDRGIGKLEEVVIEIIGVRYDGQVYV